MCFWESWERRGSREGEGREKGEGGMEERGLLVVLVVDLKRDFEVRLGLLLLLALAPLDLGAMVRYRGIEGLGLRDW